MGRALQPKNSPVYRPLWPRSNKTSAIFWADLGPRPATRKWLNTRLLRDEQKQAPRTHFETGARTFTAVADSFFFLTHFNIHAPHRITAAASKSSRSISLSSATRVIDDTLLLMTACHWQFSQDSTRLTSNFHYWQILLVACIVFLALAALRHLLPIHL